MAVRLGLKVTVWVAAGGNCMRYSYSILVATVSEKASRTAFAPDVYSHQMFARRDILVLKKWKKKYLLRFFFTVTLIFFQSKTYNLSSILCSRILGKKLQNFSHALFSLLFSSDFSPGVFISSRRSSMDHGETKIRSPLVDEDLTALA